MPVGIGQPLQITVAGQFKGQVVNIVGWFNTDGAAFLTTDVVGVGEAFWDHIKTTWRALHVPAAFDTTLAIRVSEQGPTGAYGEYAVPTGEQQGTRSLTGLGEIEPTFVAAGFRCSVGTRATRPGQKRVWGLCENDIETFDALSPGYMALLNAFASVWTTPMVLGAPVALGVLIPIVTRVTSPGNVVTVQQDVTGFVSNPYVTSQVSRKVGRGQ